MLLELSISNVVLIDQLGLSFEPGLTAMTGETGAGKSIVLDALGLVLGNRADRALVRSGCDQARVIAYFSLPHSHPVWALIKQYELDIELGEELILRRTITKDGKSRGFINDMPVSATLLRDIGNLLVEIHGQHDGRGLMDVRNHILALDAYAGLEPKVTKCASAYTALVTAQKAADDLASQASADMAEQMYLQEAASELDRLDPKPGEELSLAAMRGMMMRSEKLLADIEAARLALETGPGIDGQLGVMMRNLEAALSRFEPEAEDLPAKGALERSLAALERAMVEIDETQGAMQDAARALVFEPNQLEQAEERLFALRALARKHKVDVDQLQQVRQDLSQRLQALENLEQAQKAATDLIEKTRAEYLHQATSLSDKRTIAARKLNKAIAKELAPLRLDKAKFITQVEVLDSKDGGRSGINRVGFEISTNPGTPLGPLASIASGGELSRISLAIKAALAANSGPSIMVFDEIDQGVGGAVADAVGRRLAALASNSQVLVITHSPQVAARAKAQFQIEKSDKDGISRTDVVLLDQRQREEEIARMLAGAKITAEAREAAKALLA